MSKDPYAASSKLKSAKENSKSEKQQKKTAKNNKEEQPKQKVEKKESTSEEFLQLEKDKFLRLFAEFENYKKRTSKERIELFKTASQELMTALLPIIDDFDRGLAEVKKAEDSELFKGMELISSKFKNVLIQKGLTEIEVKEGDNFDSEIHDAITQIPAPTEQLKGKVINCVEKGYRLGVKIIRHPKVVIGQI
ncbi:MAG: nucleotide exchange factor GrpE [Tenacibaculum sp.]